MSFDLLLRNALLFDGMGAESRPGCVGISGGRIAALGALPDASGREEIDCGGLALAPGFIDMHSHADWVLPHEDHATVLRPLLEQGITTMPYGSWSAIFVPAGTSDENTNLVFEAIKFAVSDSAVEKQINALGMEVDLSESPEEFIGFLKSEAARLNIAVDKYGLRGN